ncbi:MAG TPA: restriction endonuclease subunit S [Gemmataceae bacterium]|nr:restriction endonuclease subunit S [Gemmataceae bacterium]
MSELKMPWPTLPLMSIASEMCLGKMLDKAKNRGTLKPYLRNVNVRWFTFDLSDMKEMRFEDGEDVRFGLQNGDLVVCEGGEPGRAAVWSDQADNAKIQKALHRIRFGLNEYDPYFAMYFLYWGTISNRFSRFYTGTTIKHLTGAALSRVHFPVAPLNEQRRIVAKIEELFSNLDAGVAALERAKANLKRYRAAVLKAAVDGSLTAEWRTKHPNVEPASRLLERILVERRRKWEADQLAKFAAAGKEPPKNWKAKYVEPSPPDTSNLPELPNGWCWATLDAVAGVVGGVTKDKKRDGQPGRKEIAYLRVANVQRGFLDLSEIKSIAATEEDIHSLRLQNGDVLFTEGGDRDKLGRGWVWSDELPECIHQNHIFRARLYLREMQPRMLSHHGNSFGKEWFIKAGKQTTNLASINLGILKRFPVPVAPSGEQCQIVAELDERLSVITSAEVEVERGFRRAARLRQSILKQAFEGKLVPQDPEDEPASELLARLKVARHDRFASNGKTNGEGRRPKKARASKARS